MAGRDGALRLGLGAALRLGGAGRSRTAVFGRAEPLPPAPEAVFRMGADSVERWPAGAALGRPAAGRLLDATTAGDDGRETDGREAGLFLGTFAVALPEPFDPGTCTFGRAIRRVFGGATRAMCRVDGPAACGRRDVFGTLKPSLDI